MPGTPLVPPVDNLSPEHIELERTRILEGEGGVTHMHYRVHKLMEAIRRDRLVMCRG